MAKNVKEYGKMEKELSGHPQYYNEDDKKTLNKKRSNPKIEI